MVGPALDSFSYSQDEEAVVYLGGFPEYAPFPDADGFLNLMRW